MRKLIIRTSGPDDIAAIEQLCQHFLALTPYGGILGDVPAEALVPCITQCQQAGIILVAEVDGQLIGFIAMFALMHPFARVPYADELAWWVEPEHRKGRVGYYLLRSAEDWARQNGLKMLKLASPAHDPAVGTFLERRGFTEVERTFHKRLD